MGSPKLPVIGPELDERFAQSVSKLVGIWQGTQGDPLDRLITMRDLIDNGIVSFRSNETASGKGVMDAEFKNLVVDTLQIEGEAVTVPVSGSWSSTVTLAKTPSKTTLLTVTADAGPPGYVVSHFHILLTARFDNTATAAAITDAANLEIYVDGVLKSSGGVGVLRAHEKTAALAYILDAPSHGEHTIQVKGWSDVASYVDAKHGQLLILGTKR